LWGGEKEEGRGGGDDRAQERILVDRRGEEMYDERIRAPPGTLSLSMILNNLRSAACSKIFESMIYAKECEGDDLKK
jgi:hypothetical protein